MVENREFMHELKAMAGVEQSEITRLREPGNSLFSPDRCMVCPESILWLDQNLGNLLQLPLDNNRPTGYFSPPFGLDYERQRIEAWLWSA